MINLEKRLEKWEKTKKQIESIGYHPNRFSAVDGWQLDIKTLDKIRGSEKLMTKGQVGCLLSHLSVLFDAYQKNYKVIWVLEDDVVATEKVDIDNLIAELSIIDPEWDILYTDADSKNVFFIVNRPLFLIAREGKSIEDPSHFKKRRKINETFSEIYSRYGAYSMIISDRGVKKILDYFLFEKFFRPYDDELFLVPGIRQYITNKEYITVNPHSPSDTVKYYP